MKLRVRPSAAAFAALLLLSSGTLFATAWNDLHAGNPVVPGYFADPCVRKFGDTYYLYATPDGWGVGQGPFVIWTSKDFVHWTANMSAWPNTDYKWAPSVVYKNGLYYMYTQVPCQVYVATATSPLGPWTNAIAGGGCMIPDQTPTNTITLDGECFIDTDGQAYLMYGTWWTPTIMKLNPDLISWTDTPIQYFTYTGYTPPKGTVQGCMEAPYMYKSNNIYYYMYSDYFCGDSSYQVEYSTGAAPQGPWTYGANNPILSTSADDTVDGPGHHTILEDGGKVYIIYHRHDNPHNSDGSHRQVCIDVLKFNADGSIAKVVPTHSGVGFLAPSTVRDTDLAFGKPATASSSAGSNFPPAYATDENNGTLWKASDYTYPQWLQVDLGAGYSLKRCETEFQFTQVAYRYKIEYSPDGTNWSTFTNRTSNTTSGSMVDSLGTAITGRYVKITLIGDNTPSRPSPEVGIWNFKVYDGVDKTNQPPTVNAGADAIGAMNTALPLHGNAWDDGLPYGPITNVWTKVSGPGTVTIANPALLETTATFSALGTYVLQLAASDGSLTGSDTVTYSILAQYTLTASAGTGGSISPSTNVVLFSGQSQTYTITPSFGYGITNVVVDSVSQGVLSSYTFTNVTANHTIAASFYVLPRYAISGKVTVQGTQTAIAGATVYFGDSPNASVNPRFTTTTDASGNYSQAVPNDTWYIDVSASSYNSAAERTLTISNQPASGVNFALVPDSNVRGTVTRASGGAAVSGATVCFYNSAGAAANPVFTATTDTNGNYTQAVQDGVWYVSAGATGFYGSPDKIITMSAADVTGINFALVSSARNIPKTTNLLFSVVTESLPASGATGNWLTYIPSGLPFVPISGTPTVQQFGGVNWEQNVYTNGTGLRLENPSVPNNGQYTNPIPLGSGATIVLAAKPARDGISDAWDTIVDVFFNQLALGVRNDNGQIMIGVNDNTGPNNTQPNNIYFGPTIPNGQTTIISLVVSNNGQFVVYTNGTQAWTGTASLPNTGRYTQLTPGARTAGNVNSFASYIDIGREDPDGWSAYNGYIGDVFIYTNALANADRQTLEADLTTKYNYSTAYQITASANAGGTLNPGGTVYVAPGGTQAFSMAPGAGNAVSNVVVDGVSKGAISAFTFTNVSANHTLIASFAPSTLYTITASAGPGGSISPSGATAVYQGQNQAFTIGPLAGYAITNIIVDGVSQGAISSFTFTNVFANHTIAASFVALPTYTITASAGAGGTISPSGATVVFQGQNQVFTIAPLIGYGITGVTVDGVVQGAISSFTFTNVAADHTIAASFAAVPALTIAALAGPNGSISPSGTVLVSSGAGQAFVLTPNAGCFVSGVVVDGVSQGAVSSYTFTNVVANHTISASFVAGTPPVVWYKFDESSGTAAFDSSGNGKTASLVNSPTWVAGKYGNAVSLSGSSQNVSGPAGLVSSLNDFSITAWVYLNANSTWSRIFDFGTGTTTNMFLTPEGGAGKIRFAITINGSGSEQRIDGAAVLPTGSWQHVAVALSGTTGVLYVNGAPVGTNTSMTIEPSALGNTTQNYIGKSQYSDPYLNGLVDEFRIYPKGLSAAEVLAVYNGTYTITASAGAHGSINPSGLVSVDYGASQTFAIAPDSGYAVAQVMVDNIVQGAISSYTFTNVNMNHAISAIFASPAPPTLTISANGSGGLEITWPDTCTGQLLWSPTLGPGAIWTPVGGTPAHVGGLYKVTVMPGSGVAFYGLGQ